MDLQNQQIPGIPAWYKATLPDAFISIMSIDSYKTLNGKYISSIWQLKEMESDMTWLRSHKRATSEPKSSYSNFYISAVVFHWFYEQINHQAEPTFFEKTYSQF